MIRHRAPLQLIVLVIMLQKSVITKYKKTPISFILSGFLGFAACGSPPPLDVPDDGQQCQGVNCLPDMDGNKTNNTNTQNNQNNTTNNTTTNNTNTKNECIEGQTECVGDDQMRSCRRDESGFYWGTPESCGSGKCANNKCCVNPCQPGEKSCSINGIQTCELQANGCYDYGHPQPCPNNGMCNEAGECVQSCVSDCQKLDIRCFPEGSPAYRDCVEVEPGCYKWNDIEKQCPANTLCKNKTCEIQCTHECTTAQLNRTRCDINVEKRCTADANGCRSWVPTGSSCVIQGQAPCDSLTLGRVVAHGSCVQVNYNWANCAADCGWGLCNNGQWYCQRNGLGACTQQFPHNACSQ